MREWARPLLRCPSCRTADLRPGAEGLACGHCGLRFSSFAGVVDLLVAPHPVVVRERSAVVRLDGGEVALAERLTERLGRLETQTLAAEDYTEFPCLRHAAQGREQIRELLARYPLAPGEIVLDAGGGPLLGEQPVAGRRLSRDRLGHHRPLAPRPAGE